MRRRAFAAMTAFGMCLAAPNFAVAETEANRSLSGFLEMRKGEMTGTHAQVSHAGSVRSSTPVENGYASINGLDMYYEIHGAGEPLVLLHGTLSAIGTSFGDLLPPLASSRQVIAVEQQAHGRTADINRPLSYERMADDTNALLQHLDIETADIFGYSMGGNIALQIAIRHPDRVRKLILASATYSTGGFDAETFAAIKALKPEDWAGTPFHEEYVRVSPDPDVPELVEKAKQLVTGFQGWSPDDIRSVKAPSLIMVGDSGAIRPEHAAELFRLLAGGSSGPANSQLAVLPGTDHVALVHRTDWLLSMILAFLDAPMPRSP